MKLFTTLILGAAMLPFAALASAEAPAAPAAAPVPAVVAASAPSLGFKQKMAEQDGYLADEVKYANETCGTSITAKFDWASFAAAEADLQSYSASGYCGDAGDAVGSVCTDALGKESVAKSIKGITCKLGKERAVELKDGNLTYTIQWDASNNADYIKEYLLKNLK